MQCPHCSLLNPDKTLLCDCGWDFANARTTKGAQEAHEWSRRNELIVGAVGGFVLVGTVLFLITAWLLVRFVASLD